MTIEQWIAEADSRIADEKETIQIMHRTSSREAFWSEVRRRAENAELTIAFLEEGKRLIQGE